MCERSIDLRLIKEREKKTCEENNSDSERVDEVESRKYLDEEA